MASYSRLRQPLWFTFLGVLLLTPQFSGAAVTLAVSPSTVNLPGVNAGSTTSVSDSSASLSATGSGTATFTYSIVYGTAPVAYKSAQTWLSVSTPTTSITAGGSKVAITVKGNPTGLQAGPYTATVTFTAGASNAQLTVTFTPQGVDLTASLKAPLSSVTAGLPSQQAGQINVALTNANGSSTTQTIQVSTKTDNGANWLLTSADSPLSVTGPGVIAVTVDATNLAGGSGHTATITIGCVNGAPCEPQSIPVSVSITAAAPTLTAISPASGSIGATVAVTLTGTNLTGASSINVGAGISVSSLHVVSATQITANFVIPANANTGPQNVNVTTPVGTSHAVTFTLIAAITLSVSPAGACTGVVGACVGFSGSAGDPNPHSDSSESLNASGSGTVSFSTSIAYGPPVTAYPTSSQNWLSVATSATPPNTITPGVSVPITVQVNFAGLQAGNYIATITFKAGTQTATLTVLVILNGTDLTATMKVAFPPVAVNKTATNTITVGVANASGTPAAGVQVQTISTPSTWLSTNAEFPGSYPVPNSGTGALTVTVNTQKLQAGSTTQGRISVSCLNATCLSQTVPVSIQVLSPQPTLTSISPGSGTAGSTVAVTLDGSYLTGATAVSAGGGISVAGFGVLNDSQVTATFTIPANAPSGASNVTVTTASGVSNAVTFTITQSSTPTLTTIFPNSGALGTTVPVTLTGNNLAGATSINAGAAITINGFTVVSNSQVNANFVVSASAPAGSQAVTVTTPGGISNSVGFTITQVAPTTVTAVLPHVAAGGSFVTGFSVVNSGTSQANFSISFHDDTGAALPLPFSGGMGTLATLSGTIPPKGTGYYEAGDPNNPNGVSGSGLITSDPSITIQALFRRVTSNVYYEAAVPSTAGSNQFEIPFDATIFPGNGAQLYTGFAIANVDTANSANVTCTARDSQGNLIPNAITVPNLNPSGHWANYLFQALSGNRGTITCTSNTKIGTTALRALGLNAISSLPVVVGGAAAAAAGVLPHIAAGGSFVTGFYVFNSGTSQAHFSISFHDNNGNALPLPFTSLGSLTTLSDTIPPNGLIYYEAGDPNNPNGVSGSGLVTSDPSITIQTLFRRDTSNVYYEAAVPVAAGSNEFEIPFDATVFAANGAQIYTGFAIANLDTANPATINCTAKDSQGNLIPNAITVPNLNPSGHWANYLFQALSGNRGTIDCTSNTKVGAMALRALGLDAISSLPVITLQ